MSLVRRWQAFLAETNGAVQFQAPPDSTDSVQCPDHPPAAPAPCEPPSDLTEHGFIFNDETRRLLNEKLSLQRDVLEAKYLASLQLQTEKHKTELQAVNDALQRSQRATVVADLARVRLRNELLRADAALDRLYLNVSPSSQSRVLQGDTRTRSTTPPTRTYQSFTSQV